MNIIEMFDIVFVLNENGIVDNNMDNKAMELLPSNDLLIGIDFLNENECNDIEVSLLFYNGQGLYWNLFNGFPEWIVKKYPNMELLKKVAHMHVMNFFNNRKWQDSSFNEKLKSYINNIRR